jgi:hypothetical protein
MPLRRKIMKKTIVSTLASLLMLSAITFAQAPQNPPPVPGQPGGGPAYAFDITKAEVDMVNKNDPTTDRQLRVVDMGKYNLGVGIIHRGPTNDKPGDPIQADLSLLHSRSLRHPVRRGRPHNGRGDRQF